MILKSPIGSDFDYNAFKFVIMILFKSDFWKKHIPNGSSSF